MTDIAIRVENLSKQYRIGGPQARYKTIRESLTEAVQSPFRRLSSVVRGQSSAVSNETIWALKDVSFEVKRGEVVGIIGRNGAGKTTLLKVLSRITEPTEGYAEIHGRVGSLLEVGTGFHPELTGRENIYLNGAILGMKRTEIDHKFDEIVAFAEIEKFMDTPVKHYSSGMYVRLAFAVAAHLEPEILLVDEVLAVGDAAFQKKCLGKMDEIGRTGRTVLLVSHNMGSILQLCKKAILLEKGHLRAFAAAREVTQHYLQQFSQGNVSLDTKSFQGTLSSILQFEEVSINDLAQTDGAVISPSSPITIKVAGTCKQDIPAFRINFSIFTKGVRLFTLHDAAKPELLPRGNFESEVEIPAFFLRPGDYSVAIGGYRDGGSEWMWGMDLLAFSISEEWEGDYEFINIGLVNLPVHGKRRVFG